MTSTQMGRFKIDEQEVRDNPDRVALVLSFISAVPVRVEMLFAERKLAFVALSPKFEELEPGSQIPEYALGVTEAGGLTSVVVMRT